jgi:hypothetical protein
MAVRGLRGRVPPLTLLSYHGGFGTIPRKCHWSIS